MGKFIYAFSNEDRDMLLSLGLILLQENKIKDKTIYVFENSEHGKLDFKLGDGIEATSSDSIPCGILSDTLTF